MSGEELAEVAAGCRPVYDCEVDMNSDSTHAIVVRLVGPGKRVLELGCATGYMSRVLRDMGCQVVGIEIDDKMAASAAAFCERVIVGDIERVDLPLELGEDRFDVIVAADVLEHLKNPLSTLCAIKQYLRPDGYVVASIPNVAHGSVRLALLNGRFSYTEKGLLDRTHLRFYTAETMEQLFADAGFAIGRLERKEIAIDATEVKYDQAAVPPALWEVISRDPVALTYQFIVVAYPMPIAGLSWIQQRMLELAKEKGYAEREVAQLQHIVEEQSKHLEALAGRLENEKGYAEREVAQLRHIVEEQSKHLEALAGRLEVVSTREVPERDAVIRDLRATLERVRRSPPARIYIGMRKIVTLFRG